MPFSVNELARMPGLWAQFSGGWFSLHLAGISAAAPGTLGSSARTEDDSRQQALASTAKCVVSLVRERHS